MSQDVLVTEMMKHRGQEIEIRTNSGHTFMGEFADSFDGTVVLHESMGGMGDHRGHVHYVLTGTVIAFTVLASPDFASGQS